MDKATTQNLRQCAAELKIFIVANFIDKTNAPDMNATLSTLQLALEEKFRARPLGEQYPEYAGLFKGVDETNEQIKITNAQIARVDEQIARVDKQLENAMGIVTDTQGWQKNHDYGLEVTITQVVWRHEQSSVGSHPDDILKVYKRGTILKQDGTRPRCQVDGLFQRKDKTWIVCEAKSHLTMDELEHASNTLTRFRSYLADIRELMVPDDFTVLDNNSFWLQVQQFKKLAHPDVDTVVAYLGYASREARINAAEDPVFQARERGFIVVKPTEFGYVVDT